MESGDPYGRFVALAPFRVYDSRNDGAEGSVTAGVDRVISVGGGGVPENGGAGAIVANVTVTGGSERGDLQVYPTGSVPSARTSNLNYEAGQTSAVAVTVGVGPGATISLSANTGSVHVVVDTFGFYTADNERFTGGAPGVGYSALSPRRVLDTREGNAPVRAQLAADPAHQLGQPRPRPGRRQPRPRRHRHRRQRHAVQQPG